MAATRVRVARGRSSEASAKVAGVQEHRLGRVRRERVAARSAAVDAQRFPGARVAVADVREALQRTTRVSQAPVARMVTMPGRREPVSPRPLAKPVAVKAVKAAKLAAPVRVAPKSEPAGCWLVLNA
jgi:hypothetical protein